MGKAADRFRQSDVVTWGLIALASAGIAMVAANLSTALPSDVTRMLHSARLDNATIEGLATRTEAVEREARALRQAEDTLRAQLNQQSRQADAVRRRVGAIEVSLPRLIEAIETAPEPEIDRSLPTASIETAPVTPTEGGAVRVEYMPLPGLEAPTGGTLPDQPLPAPIAEHSAVPVPIADMTYGIAIGPGILPNRAEATWQDLSSRLGSLLLGLEPLVVADANATRQRLVAGPMNDLAAASDMCLRIERVSIACQPVPYTGSPLADMNERP